VFLGLLIEPTSHELGQGRPKQLTAFAPAPCVRSRLIRRAWGWGGEAVVLATFPDRLRAMRGPGESYSDVILRLAGEG
jgi:hypothetical protein